MAVQQETSEYLGQFNRTACHEANHSEELQACLGASQCAPAMDAWQAGSRAATEPLTLDRP